MHLTVVSEPPLSEMYRWRLDLDSDEMIPVPLMLVRGICRFRRLRS